MIARTVKKDTLYIALFVFLMMLASLSNSVMVAVLGILIILFTYLNVNKVKSNSIIIPKIALSLLLFQNFSIGIGAHFGKNFSSGLSLITQVPTLFIVISYLVIILNNRIKARELIYFGYIIVCLVFFFVGSGNATAKMTYLRNFLIFYMAFEIGRYYLNTEDKIKQFINFFLNVTIIAVIFGIIGIIIGKSFYQLVGVLEVYKAKQYTAYRNGLPGNFMTIFGGVWVNRFASLYYDPVNFSYYMALACLIAYILKKRKLFIIFMICEILTFGKGGLLILGLVLLCVIAQSILRKYNVKVVRFFIIVLAISGVIVLVGIIQTHFSDDFGTYNHFYGMITGIMGIKQNPLGYGLGTAGNLIKTATVNSQAVSETGLINMAYQIGIVGVVWFCYLLLSTGLGAFKTYKCTKNKLSLLCSFLPLTLLIVSVFQENTYTPQCIVPYMLIIGSMWNGVEKYYSR